MKHFPPVKKIKEFAHHLSKEDILKRFNKKNFLMYYGLECFTETNI